jgi:hypothetical protein
MPREVFDDPRMERLQLRIDALERILASATFLDGVKVEAQSIATTPTSVSHRLGKAPRGFLVLSVTPDASIGFSATQPTQTDKFANLEASAAATATLWFF